MPIEYKTNKGLTALLVLIAFIVGVVGYAALDNTNYNVNDINTAKERSFNDGKIAGTAIGYTNGYNRAKLDIKPITVTKVITEELNLKESYIDPAIDDLIEWLDDEDELTCSGREYDVDEVGLKSLRSYDIEYSSNDDDVLKITFNARLKYLRYDNYYDEYVEKCYRTYRGTMYYEDNDLDYIDLDED